MKMHGFTLFEILVAVSIFAVISSMSMSSLIQVGRTGEKVSETQRQLSEIQFALAYLSKDIVQMVNRKVRDQYGDEQPQLLIAENRLAFTRNGWSNLLQQPRSSLQRVQYQLVDNNFQRRYWPELDQSYTEVSVTQTLLQKVESFTVKLLTTGQETFDIWPADALNNSALRPIAIELTLNISGLGQVQRIYEISDVLL